MPDSRADRSFRITPGTRQASIEGELIETSAAEINRLVGLTVTGQELSRVAAPGGFRQELTATGDVQIGTYCLDLNHASVAIVATMDARDHVGFFAVCDTSASGTAGHSLQLTTGTFDGTNNKVVLNAPGENLFVFFDGTGRGRILGSQGQPNAQRCVIMAKLPNHRHEMFAQALAKGTGTVVQCYLDAGYSGKPEASGTRASASRLQADANIQGRVAELQAKASTRAVYTLDKLVKMLAADRKFARTCENPSAAVSATMGIAKLLGIGGIAAAAADPETETDEGAAAGAANPNVIAMKDALKKLRGG